MTWETKAVIFQVMGFVIVFFCAVFAAVLCWETLSYRKRGENPPYQELFDERQTMIRRRAATHALWMLIGYLVLWWILDMWFQGEGAWAWTRRPAVLIVGGLCLAMSVFAGECALRDAYEGWNTKKSGLGIKVVLCLVWGVNAAVRGAAIDEPVLAAVLYLCTAAMAVLGVIFVWAYVQHKKRAQPE